MVASKKTEKKSENKTKSNEISQKDIERALEKTIEKKLKRSKIDVDKALIENFVNLQKVLTDLTTKFDNLAINIAKLLHLFELSAKSFSRSPGKAGVDEEFLKKLDSLLDQNKTISKGIMMMEERIRNRSGIPISRSGGPLRQDISGGGMVKTRPLPRF